MARATFRASDLTRHVTLDIHLKGLLAMRWRLVLASAIFRIGSIVAGTEAEITVEVGTKESDR